MFPPPPDRKNRAKPEKTIPFFSIFRFASKKDKLIITIGCIAGLAEGACQPLFAIIFGNVTNSFASDDSDSSSFVDEASSLALKYIYVGILGLVGGYLAYSSWMRTGEKTAIDIRKRYFKSLLQQEIAFYDTINPNEMSTKISEECFNIQEGIGSRVPTFCHCIGMLVSGLVVGLVKGWQLSLILLGFSPITVVVGALFISGIQKLSKINNEAFAKAGAISEEVLNAIRTVVSLSGHLREMKRYENTMLENAKLIAKYTVIAGLSIGVIIFTIQFVQAFGFFIGAVFIKNEINNPTTGKAYTSGDVLTVFMAIMNVTMVPTMMTPCLKAFTIAKQNAVKAFEIIDRVSKISIHDEKGLKPSGCTGNIKFRDVTFAYPMKKERIILNGISFEIKPNQKTALVGESGCGKTTCMQLIERFYDIESGNGSITLDGNELKELNLRWMRDNIGYVGQEPVLFATSIRENLLMAKEDATDDQIWDALKKANAAEFVKGLPDKLGTFVGNSGTALSGGQKQRLAIARAILKNPRILLLDEATSALDRKNEMEIQKTLDEISVGRTTIVIAHRLSTIINTDHILVFDEGKVVEEGTHEELVARKGKYYALQHLQLQTQMMDQAKVQTEKQQETEKQCTTTTSGEQKDDVETPLTKTPQEVEIKVDDGLKKKKKKSEEKKVKNSLMGLFIRLYAYSKDDIKLIIAGCAAGAIQGCTFPMMSVLMSNMLTILSNPEKSNFNSRIALFCGLFLVNAVVAMIAMAIQTSCFGLAAERISRRLRRDVFKKYVTMHVGWFDEPANAPGALGSRLSTDATVLNTLTGQVLSNYVQAVASFCAGVVIAFVGDWRLALLGLASAPLIIFAGFSRAFVAKKNFEGGKDAYTESIKFASEAVNNMRTVASFGTEDKLLKNYSDKLAGPEKSAVKTASLSAIALGVGNFFNYAIYGMMFYVGVILMRDHGLSFTNMYMAIMGVNQGCSFLSNALQFASDIGNAHKAAANIFGTIDTKSAIDIDDPRQVVKKPIKGDIEFRNVWFKYPTREKQILENFNLKIDASKKIALVGPSGCGKSTVLALLQRFYDVDQGEILIDGINIKDYDLTHLRRTYGVVSQEPVLFNGTIEYNIKYAKQEASNEEMREAASRANALGFIEKNEFDQIEDAEEAAKKYGTGFQRKVGPKGSQLSGGQKQRIAIARAIITNPSVLILDEATSALDAENEKVVQEALDQIMTGKTSVIVAHRISTIRDADEILVFSDGQIIERGNYQQLTERQGAFYKLERGTNQGLAR